MPQLLENANGEKHSRHYLVEGSSPECNLEAGYTIYRWLSFRHLRTYIV